MLKTFNTRAVSENIHTITPQKGLEFPGDGGNWGGGVCETKQIKEMQIRIFTELYNVMFLVSAGADL